jgi:sec-independent protein translocase protein TatA
MGLDFPIHWILILLVVVLLFGGRKIPEMMRGMGEGIRSFKEGMRGGDHAPNANTVSTPQAAPTTLTSPATPPPPAAPPPTPDKQ